MTISQRTFGKQLIHTAAASAAATVFPSLLVPATGRSPVIIARSDTLKRQGNHLPEEQVAPFLDRALIKLTGASTAVRAWQTLVSPRETIGIKLSCLPGKPLSSSVGLVMAVVNGLRAAGISDRNIHVWERSNRELEAAGFKTSRTGPRIEGTDAYPGDGYSDEILIHRSVGTRFSRIMEKLDALINIPVLKDHDLSGVSIGMKNFYGAIYNPNKFHRNNCDPYIADLNAFPMIKDKLRLILCDASRVQINNGPAFFPRYALEYGGLLVARDPVALDYVGWGIIEELRQKAKLKPLKAVKREPRYIRTAADLKLGTTDEKHIQRIHI